MSLKQSLENLEEMPTEKLLCKAGGILFSLLFIPPTTRRVLGNINYFITGDKGDPTINAIGKLLKKKI